MNRYKRHIVMYILPNNIFNTMPSYHPLLLPLIEKQKVYHVICSFRINTLLRTVNSLQYWHQYCIYTVN
jgi:hypothetical protein